MKKNVIIFGGSGFLGSHVCEDLCDNKFNVTVFDRNKLENIPTGVKFIRGDIVDFKNVLKSVKGNNLVFNFAALSDINKALNDPFGTIKYNILGTYNILEAARRNKIKRVIHASTIYAYNDDGGFYGCSKKSAELYIKEFYKKYKLNYTIIRYGSLYGPGSTEDNQIYKIIKRALKNGKIEYQGSPDNIREYIHVIDAAKIASRILSKQYANKSVIASGYQSMPVKQLLELIAGVMKIKKSKITFKNKKLVGHYQSTPYSHSKDFDRKIVYESYIDLGQGILNLVKYVSNQNK